MSFSPQHLSDQAVAAFADGVLAGSARGRASRHTAECPECAYAVAVQREAVWALRAAPAPPLPTGLLSRLRDVPQTASLNLPTPVLGPDGSLLMATFGSAEPAGGVVAAAAAPVPEGQRRHLPHARPIVGAAVAVAAVGVLAVSSAAHASGGSPITSQQTPAAPAAHVKVRPAIYVSGGQHR